MTSISDLIAIIQKEHGADSIFLGSDWQKQEVNRISTGSLFLDWATNGGIPMGKTTEIFGNESAGKSAIAAKIIVEAQKKKMTCLWVDAEKSFDSAWMTTLGVDVSRLVVSQIAESEEGFDILFKAINLGNPRSKEYHDFEPVDLIILDSLTAFAPMAITDNDMQTHMAVDARVNNLGFKRINARNHNTAIVIINQNRSTIGGPRAGDFQPGGRGLKFFASLRIELRAGEWIKPNDIPSYLSVPVNPKNKEAQVGHTVKARVRKCKVGGPHGKEAEFDFYYNGKIDRIKDIIAAGRVTGIITQSGAFYKYDGINYRGAKAFADFLKSDRAALIDIRKQVMAAI